MKLEDLIKATARNEQIITLQDLGDSTFNMNRMYELETASYASTNAVTKGKSFESVEGKSLVIQRLQAFQRVLNKELSEVEAIITSIDRGEGEEQVLTDIADLLGDLMVYVMSEANKFGLAHLMPMFLTAIQASNKSKLGADGKPIKDADNKFLKGPNYWRPEPVIKWIIQQDRAWHREEAGSSDKHHQMFGVLSGLALASRRVSSVTSSDFEWLPQDLRTHLGDFKTACQIALNLTDVQHNPEFPDDRSYWEHQVKTIENIERLIVESQEADPRRVFHIELGQDVSEADVEHLQELFSRAAAEGAFEAPAGLTFLKQPVDNAPTAHQLVKAINTECGFEALDADSVVLVEAVSCALGVTFYNK